MCGLVGIIGKQAVNQDIFDALTALQHRGQDAAGVMTCDGEQLHLRKSKGLVRDVVRVRHMLRLKGNMGIGHVRYPTAGSDSEAEAQPFYVNSPYGISLAHNGNLTNAAELKKALWQWEMRHLNTSSDSEIMLNVLAHELQALQMPKPTPDVLFAALQQVYARCHGGYAVVAMITGFGLLAFRDPHGIRPICYGVREGEGGAEYMVASESVALDAAGFRMLGDLAPGEGIYITVEGQIHRRQCATDARLNPCIFEHVYLARPDSFIDGISVYKYRLRLGERLAEKILREVPEHDIDVVIPVPDTSRTAALPLALKLGVKYREGFVKNRYIGRTFIMPGQAVRRKSVRQKLNTIGLEFKDKNVLLVDDSIVRGTTSKEIIKMARDAGAKKVYFASAAPEVQYPNIYGIDMPTADELIAHGRSTDEICQAIGADGLFYQDLEVLSEAAREGNGAIERFEDSVFTGDYVTGDITPEYLAAWHHSRGKGAEKGEEATSNTIDMHNND